MKIYLLSFRAEVGCLLRVVAKDVDEAIDHLLHNVDGERLCKTDVDVDGDDRFDIRHESIEVSEEYDG